MGKSLQIPLRLVYNLKAMLSFLFSLIGDILIFKLIWRGYKMTRQGQNRMFETERDYKLRVKTGWAIIFFGMAAIFLNHFLFNFDGLRRHSSSE